MVSLQLLLQTQTDLLTSSPLASVTMPGHIKLVKGAVDPDPTEFLLPSIEMKKEDQNKPYDPKKSVWISDPKTHGYKEGLLEVGDILLEDPAAKVVVAVGHEEFPLLAKEVGRVNPPKFEKCEDMANLTFLSEAAVFWNLKTRYQVQQDPTLSLNPSSLPLLFP